MKAEYLLHRNTTTINVQQQKNNPLQLLELIYSIQQTSRQSRKISNSIQLSTLNDNPLAWKVLILLDKMGCCFGKSSRNAQEQTGKKCTYSYSEFYKIYSDCQTKLTTDSCNNPHPFCMGVSALTIRVIDRWGRKMHFSHCFANQTVPYTLASLYYVSKTETLYLCQKTLRHGAILFWISQQNRANTQLRWWGRELFFSLFGEIHMRQGGVL